ncbi:hypothetical protein BH24ACI5_BH24ACI5_19490 [soil metagenome]
MMRNTVSALLAAVVVALPSLAAAQALPAIRERQQRPPHVIVERQREARRVAQMRDNRPQETERVTHTFTVGGSGELQVSNLSGDITITRGRGNEIQVEAVKTARARTAEEARAMLPAVRVDFAERAGRAEVKVIYPRQQFTPGSQRNNISVSVAYTITAPEGTRITAKSLSGNVKVTGIKGELTLQSTSGDVGAFEASRVVSAASTSGNVEVADLRSDLPAELKSISGDIIVRQARTPRLELSTISGNMILDNVQVERVEAQSISGDLAFTGGLARGGRYDLNSHSGNVTITLTGGSGFELDANSFSGNVQTGLELKDRSTGAAGTGRGGRTRRLRGIHGDGDALLDITTFSGNVTITKK